VAPGGGGIPIHQRRCSEFYPPPAIQARQGRRDRRLSDPGRLEVPLLRVSLHGGGGDPSTNGDRCLQPGVRLSDPRLDAIRSLLDSGPCEVGEALPAAAPSSPPLLHRAGRRRCRDRGHCRRVPRRRSEMNARSVCNL